jgi:MinD-like ATPase involved in chromosome partitioning or flagellar assembly
VDLPTYTNIWRIEKRLYKLYDFRLPAPLPITWIGVFVGITVPYVIFLIAVGLPFNHTLVWLYILPPGVLTWLTTRPVIENKRLPELVSSQLRYLAEPRTWCRMAPFAEKDDIVVSARVWHHRPPKARPKKAKTAPAKARPAKARPSAPAPQPAGNLPRIQLRSVQAGRAVAKVLAPVPERALPRRTPKRAQARAEAKPAWAPWPQAAEPDAMATGSADQMAEPGQRPAWISPPPAETRDARLLEVAHDSDPGVRAPDEPRGPFTPSAWPPPEANLLPLIRRVPEPSPFPEAGAFPEVRPFPEDTPSPDQDAGDEPDPAASADPAAGGRRDAPHRYRSMADAARWARSGLRPALGRKADRGPAVPAPPAAEAPTEEAPRAAPAWPRAPAMSSQPRARWMLRVQPRPRAARALEAPARPAPVLSAPLLAAPVSAEPDQAGLEPVAPAPEAAEPAAPVPPAARFIGVERGRPLPSIERALSGPGSSADTNWRRQVRVVAGGQGPGKRDRETLDRDRARRPLDGPRRLAVLGCTRGAGQTVTALMTSHILAVVRGIPVAVLDMNPSATSLAAWRAPAASARALLAGQDPDPQAGQLAGPGWTGQLDVIADPPGTGPVHTLDAAEYQRLAALLAERYELTLIDPAPSSLTRVLATADQLVLVAPASPDAATSLANTQQWLGAHGYGELGARAVTVVNGVSRRTMEDVLRAESVARGRCRAIVRVPWDDVLSSRPGSSSTLQPQTRLAYTALAGVLVAGMSVAPASPVAGRNAGEHSD